MPFRRRNTRFDNAPPCTQSNRLERIMFCRELPPIFTVVNLVHAKRGCCIWLCCTVLWFAGNSVAFTKGSTTRTSRSSTKMADVPIFSRQEGTITQAYLGAMRTLRNHSIVVSGHFRSANVVTYRYIRTTFTGVGCLWIYRSPFKR